MDSRLLSNDTMRIVLVLCPIGHLLTYTTNVLQAGVGTRTMVVTLPQ